MTGRKSADREELDRLADFLIEDVLETSDDDVLAEVREDGLDPQIEAASVRALFEQAVLQTNRRRLLAAKAAVRAEHSAARHSNSPVSIQEARQRLQVILDQKEATPALTLAARNEAEMSEADILSLLQDLEELGIVPPDKKKN